MEKLREKIKNIFVISKFQKIALPALVVANFALYSYLDYTSIKSDSINQNHYNAVQIDNLHKYDPSSSRIPNSNNPNHFR